MLVGVPKEIKDNEFRVGMTPAAVAELVHHGHSAIVEKGAGAGSGSPDEEYVRSGAELVDTPQQIFARADMIVKVKEPLAQERKLLRPGQILFTYLHLAPDRPQTEDLIASGAICIAYETVTDPQGRLPLLTPMSEVAGRLAPQVGAHSLEKAQGGRGVLLGGVPGVAAANVLVLGGGVSGTHAATIAVGMGASVTVVDRSHEALRRLSTQFGSALRTVYSTRASIADLVTSADLVIGAVLLPGAAAPKLITRAHAGDDAPGRRHRRRRDRPGRLLRDVEADDPFESDLCRRRHRSLLRRQHARRSCAHLDLRAQSRDAALHPRARRQGLATGACRRSASARRAERMQRQGDLRAGRGGARAQIGERGEPSRLNGEGGGSPQESSACEAARAPFLGANRAST